MSSFNPKPYAPSSTHLPPIHLPLMDPSPSDPLSLFIHPPFNSFPDAHLYPDGLSYTVLAANPEWFLDPTDFFSTMTSTPNAIPYPPQLEPPRGWCPAKKKDLKERGAEGWPEGEEPRLRCTFCRRTYAGVNAKSMWRRHVFEKHKIAMANRREGSDRTRGRGSNKENKLSQDTSDISSSARFRSILPADRKKSDSTPSAPYLPQREFTPPPTPTLDTTNSLIKPHPLSQSTLPASPPLTPSSPSPTPARALIPPSPYDPTITPSFRHSTPRLPSDQPWRFPSPSHPLHSRAREICLSMLVASKVPPSPVTGALGSSPGAASSSPLTTSARASPRTLFAKGRLPVPLSERMGARRVEESPLRHHTRPGTTSGHMRTYSAEARAWGDDGDDPFAGMYSSWIGVDDVKASEMILSAPVPMSSPEVETESPVLRSSQLPPEAESAVGLGIGLMAPFTLVDAGKEDDALMDTSMYKDGLEIAQTYVREEDEGRRPAKRRKTVDSRDTD